MANTNASVRSTFLSCSCIAPQRLAAPDGLAENVRVQAIVIPDSQTPDSELQHPNPDIEGTHDR